MARPLTSPEGQRAWELWRELQKTGQSPELDRAKIATAVRHTLGLLAERFPGRSVEVRVVPFGAVQIIEGATHRRGTPPAVVEMDASTWLALASGTRTWSEVEGSGDLDASGERTDLSAHLPL